MKWLVNTVIASALAVAYSTGSASPLDTSLIEASRVTNNMDVSIPDDAIFLNEAPYSFLTDSNNVVEDYASLPDRITPPGERLFIFSPHLLRWAAYDPEGYLVAAGKANGGSSFCPDLGKSCPTPSGTFRIHTKGDAFCVSRKFPVGTGGAPMPYCMYFGDGFAIHGSPYISNGNTSHGCIRVYTPAAAWLSRHFIQNGTKVMILPY